MSPTASSNVIGFTGRVLRMTDNLGRRIIVRSLVATQRQQLREIFGESWENPHFAFPVEIISSVCGIDGRTYEFPRNEAEFDNLTEAVEVEGMEAAVLALERAGILVDERAKRFINWKPCKLITAPFKRGGDVA